MNGHVHQSWVTGFQSLLPSLLPPIYPAKPVWRETGEEKTCVSVWVGGWMTYGEEEGTVFYRLHLLQNGVSSLSSIPHLISPNNLPFSSCPNRESQNLRERQCAGERETEREVTPSPTLSRINSLFLCLLAGDRVINPGEKQRAVCCSEEVGFIPQAEHVPKSNKSQRRKGRGQPPAVAESN